MVGGWAEHLKILRCPITAEPLSLLNGEELDAMNERVGAGQFRHGDGSTVQQQCAAAVTNASRTAFYRFDEEIAWLLPIVAIIPDGSQLVMPSAGGSEVVRKFYDEFGWRKNADDQYEDSVAFTATSKVAQAYWRRCNSRISTMLRRRGRYLLDAASGPVVDDSYRALSLGYGHRICVDFSLAALREAKRNIGAHGLYLLGDLTSLPLADGSVDDAISLHTIYHIPDEQQSNAIGELVRVVEPGGRVVVAYTWGNSPLMNGIAALTMTTGRLRSLVRPRRSSAPAPRSADIPDLYFHPKSRRWFKDLQRQFGARLKLLSMADEKFQRSFFRETWTGEVAASLVYRLEGMFEPITARWGKYPLFVIDKPTA